MDGKEHYWLSLRLCFICICLATVALVAGYGTRGLWGWMPVPLVLGILWAVGEQQGWGLVSSVGLVSFLGIAVFGIFLGVTPGWSLLVIAAALSAWDLDYFAGWLNGVQAVEMAREMEKRHLLRLAAVAGMGLFLAGSALVIRVRFNFGLALIMGLLAILGLSQLIGFLRGESD